MIPSAGGRRPSSARPTFTTADDVLLSGRQWLSPDARATVVVAHGFTASADDPNVAAVAAALHRSRFDVISYDARGHGGSGGVSTLGDAERHDVAAAVALARQRSDTVVVVGASMGAIAVLRHAAVDPDLAGVVSVSCPSRWRLPRSATALLAAGMTRTGVGRAFAARFAKVRVSPRWANPAPPVDLVAGVASPVAFVHGARDRFIPAADARELFAAKRGPAHLEIVPDMGHAFEPAGVTAVVEAVEWTLDHAAVASAV